MKLLVILIALAFEYYLYLGDYLHRFTWFEGYLKGLRKILSPDNYWRSWWGIALIIVPVLLVLGVLLCFSDTLYGVTGLLLNVFILIYCLGPDNLHKQLQEYFTQPDKLDPKVQKELLGSDVPADGHVVHRAITSAIFVHANQRLFSVIFWYLIGGPIAALLYRLILVLQKTAQQPASLYAKLLKQVTILQELLDWLPARIMTLIYSLVGNFSGGFSYWFSHVWRGLSSNREFLSDCSLHAMDLPISDISHADIAENQAALAMIDRAVVVMLVMVALFTLGTWVG